jgi:hypothetical protein
VGATATAATYSKGQRREATLVAALQQRSFGSFAKGKKRADDRRQEERREAEKKGEDAVALS